MEQDLKIIKAKYGEQMMRLCRNQFPRILETEGLLPKLLEENFARNRMLATDIINQEKVDEFKSLIYSKLDNFSNKKSNETILNKNISAVELMAKAGYILYPECLSEADIQSFRHYYKREDGNPTPVYDDRFQPESFNGEELCTFRGDRLNTCRVWFAVHKDADKLDRMEFANPRRSDEYSRSVISIQFSRDETCTLSIKSRYNHTVNNPDNLFCSNLDNIIPGLTDAFERDYGVKENLNRFQDFELENYVRANDGKFYRFNKEINNIYYCSNNLLIDNFNVIKLPTHQILADYYVIDCKEKTVKNYDSRITDSFPEFLTNFKKINFGQNGIVSFVKQDGSNAVLKINKKNQIVAFKDDSIRNCKDHFMYYNDALQRLSMKNLERCGDGMLYQNKVLESIYLPKMEECGNFFLNSNENLPYASFPNLRKCKEGFLFFNKFMMHINLPLLEKCGDYFMCNNEKVDSLNVSSLEECGNDFLLINSNMHTLIAKKLKKCGKRFMKYNLKMNNLDVPNLEEYGISFMETKQSFRAPMIYDEENSL